jgi:hypothetical protein
MPLSNGLLGIHINAMVSLRNEAHLKTYAFDHSRFPGTKMKSTDNAASRRTVTTKTMMARLFSSLRIYGSLIREKLKNVYSLRPASAKIGSKEY